MNKADSNYTLEYLDLEEVEQKKPIFLFFANKNNPPDPTQFERFARWLDLIDR